MLNPDAVARAARAIEEAGAVVIAAGAGMGVDSGLPDFRGDHGFWNAYPPYRDLGVSFVDMANPQWFERDPAFAWGFYGHRRNLYRDTTPHAGFELLRGWADRTEHGGFVYTSNVDGQFQAAGFATERVLECHGAIEYEQCLQGCGVGIVPAARGRIPVDEVSMRAGPPLPACRCGGLLRPNILMFGDWSWDGSREEAQSERLREWLADVGDAPITVIECGAGTAVPTVRYFSERLVTRRDTTLIRINPREPDGPPGTISLPSGAEEALAAIDAMLTTSPAR